MAYQTDVVRCKQCGKIIVGKSKLGICEQCKSSDIKKGGSTILAAGFLYTIRKPIINGVKTLAKIIFKA